jgi:LysM repeat protein
MSAAVDWELAPSPSRMPSRTARPQLRLVSPEERASVPVIGLTRRGRLLIVLMVAAAALTLTIVLTNPSISGAPPRIDHATTVSVGQTLSDVAAAQLPSLPISEAVARIQLANGLNTNQVHVGQSLLIPATP